MKKIIYHSINEIHEKDILFFVYHVYGRGRFPVLITKDVEEAHFIAEELAGKTIPFGEKTGAAIYMERGDSILEKIRHLERMYLFKVKEPITESELFKLMDFCPHHEKNIFGQY